MASLRLIKRRIKTTQNIAKITRAMEMVAALKMRRAQEQALRSRPYTEKSTAILSNLTKGTEIAFHPYFLSVSQPEGEKEKIAVLLVTPSRGFCGSLVTNLFRALLLFTTENSPKVISYVTYGKKGRDFLTRQNWAVVADFEPLEPPSFERAVDLLRVLKEGFLGGKFQKVFLAYTHFASTMRQTPVISPLLPLGWEVVQAEGEDLKFNFEYLFEPSQAALLDLFLPHFLEMKVYHVLLEAYAAEQSARMMAMRSATENAQEIMTDLTLSYNKARQQIITNEIADIVTAQLGLEVK